MAAPAVIADMEWEESLLPPVPVPADLEAYVRRQFGVVPGWLARVAPAPWLARAWAALVRSPVAHLPPALCDLVALVVSQDNSCRYCFGAQRAVLRLLGYREAYIARLERDFLVAELSAADQAALDFARRVSRADPRPSRPDRERLAAAGFSAPAVAELTFTAAATVFANRIATLLALPPEPLEKKVDRPLVRLLRPLMARRPPASSGARSTTPGHRRCCRGGRRCSSSASSRALSAARARRPRAAWRSSARGSRRATSTRSSRRSRRPGSTRTRHGSCPSP